MSRRCGSSRTLGPVRQCAVYARGGLVCAWCTVALESRNEATIEHLDGNSRNNTAGNLVPACRWCNRERANYWTPGEPWWAHTALVLEMARFDAYLVTKGSSLMSAVVRVEAQRWLELPIDAGRELAATWHAVRLERERARLLAKNDAERRERAIERATRAAIRGAHGAGEVSFP